MTTLTETRGPSRFAAREAARRAAPTTRRVARSASRSRLLPVLFVGVGLALALPPRPAAAQAPEPAEVPIESDGSARALQLPLLAQAEDGVTCAPRLDLQNVGALPGRALLLTWGAASDCAACAGPAAATCSGLIAPAASWSFGPELLAGAVGGALYSLAGDAAGAEACATLAAGLPGDCAGFGAFVAAHAQGGALPGVQPGIAPGSLAGPPLTAALRRRCQDGAGAARGAEGYRGLVAPGTAMWHEEAPGGRSGYVTALPRLQAGEIVPGDEIFVRNPGPGCAEVELVAGIPDATTLRSCGSTTIPSGETAALTTAGCVDVDPDRGFLVADRPVAAVVSARDADARSAYEAPPLSPSDAASSVGRDVLFAPLAYSEYQGWVTRIEILNGSSEGAAKVKLYFLDRSGDIITTLVDWVAPFGAQTYRIPVVQALQGRWLGSARAEVTSWVGERPPVLAGVAELVRYPDVSQSRVLERGAYPLLPARHAYAWKHGHGGGGLDSGVGLIALPGIQRPEEGEAVEISVTNLVPVGGATTYQLSVFDERAFTDAFCVRLGEKMVDKLDLEAVGDFPSPRRGAALVSAATWRHELYDENGRFQRNLLGLSAAVARRAAGGSETDSLSLVTGAPLSGEGARAFARALPGLCGERIVPGATPVATAATPEQPGATSTPLLPTAGTPPAATSTPAGPTAPPSPQPSPSATPPPPFADPPSPGLRQHYLPALFDPGCRARITIQNLGREPATSILVLWGDAGACRPEAAGPLKAECSGLIRPGGAWSFSDAQLPPGARSGHVLSVSARRLTEIGAAPGLPDTTVADYLCQQVFFDVVGDAAEYAALKRALDEGGDYAGVPMDRALGAPLAMSVERDCELDAEAGDVAARGRSAYEGLVSAELGRRDPVEGGFTTHLPWIEPGASAGTGSLLHVQNAGEECASVEIWLRRPEDCASAELFEVTSLAVGERVTLEVGAGLASPASAWLRATQPLAVVAEQRSATTRTAYAAFGRLRGFEDGDRIPEGFAARDQVLFAPLVYRAREGWDARLHAMSLDPARDARVRVVWLDRAGNELASEEKTLCPRGGATFSPEGLGIPEGHVGSARLESLPASPEGEEADAPDLAGVVELRRSGPDPEAGPLERASYRMPRASTAFDAPEGHGDGGLTAGATTIGLPDLRKGLDGGGVTSHIALANLVPRPGFTDLLIYFYDQNGLLDYVCQKLNESQVEYIDLQTWGYITPGYRGSAVVSAWFWEHDVFASGDFVRNLVGLAAVQRQRDEGAASGDGASAYAGIPLSPADHDARYHNLQPLCMSFPRPGPGEPRETPRAPTPTPNGPGGERSSQAYLPYAGR